MSRRLVLCNREYLRVVTLEKSQGSVSTQSSLVRLSIFPVNLTSNLTLGGRHGGRGDAPAPELVGR